MHCSGVAAASCKHQRVTMGQLSVGCACELDSDDAMGCACELDSDDAVGCACELATNGIRC